MQLFSLGFLRNTYRLNCFLFTHFELLLVVYALAQNIQHHLNHIGIIMFYLVVDALIIYLVPSLDGSSIFDEYERRMHF